MHGTDAQIEDDHIALFNVGLGFQKTHFFRIKTNSHVYLQNERVLGFRDEWKPQTAPSVAGI